MMTEVSSVGEFFCRLISRVFSFTPGCNIKAFFYLA